jgi:CRP-like cAMP-binding protein
MRCATAPAATPSSVTSVRALQIEQRAQFEKCLQGVPFFVTLRAADRDKLLSLMHVVKFAPNEQVIQPRRRSKGFCVVFSGELRITHVNTETGERREVATVGPGGYVGENSLRLAGGAVERNFVLAGGVFFFTAWHGSFL